MPIFFRLTFLFLIYFNSFPKNYIIFIFSCQYLICFFVKIFKRENGRIFSCYRYIILYIVYTLRILHLYTYYKYDHLHFLFYAFIPSSTATATATVAPTIGLLPIPISPIISTCAGTDDEPANCASECILPIVSVIP